MSRKLFVCAFMFTFSCYNTNLIASELKGGQTLLEKIVGQASSIQDQSAQEHLE